MAKVNLADVLELSVPERVRFVQAVWDSIAEVPESLPITDSEREELDRRLEAHYRNPGESSPWPEVKSRILKR